jgi:hypothetical protein
MDDKSIFKMARSSKFLVNKVKLLAIHKPHVICEVLTSIQLKLLIAEKKIHRSESTSVDASIKALNKSIALLQQCENLEKSIKNEN